MFSSDQALLTHNRSLFEIYTFFVCSKTKKVYILENHSAALPVSYRKDSYGEASMVMCKCDGCDDNDDRACICMHP